MSQEQGGAQTEAERVKALEDWIQAATRFLLTLMDSDLSSQPWQTEPLAASIEWLLLARAALGLPELDEGYPPVPPLIDQRSSGSDRLEHRHPPLPQPDAGAQE